MTFVETLKIFERNDSHQIITSNEDALKFIQYIYQNRPSMKVYLVMNTRKGMSKITKADPFAEGM